jgi:hypothetical protein
MLPRYRRRVQRESRVGIAAKYVPAFFERGLATVVNNPVRKTARLGCTTLARRGRKCVAEAVDGPNKPRLAAALAERFAQFGNKARQRRLGHERRWPQALVQLALRDRARTHFHEHP